MILSFLTYKHMQTVQTQIRLLKEEQSDQGLHNLPFHLHLEHNLLGLKILFYLNFRESTAKFSDVRQKMTENLGLRGRFQPHVLERNTESTEG